MSRCKHCSDLAALAERSQEKPGQEGLREARIGWPGFPEQPQQGAALWEPEQGPL